MLQMNSLSQPCASPTKPSTTTKPGRRHTAPRVVARNERGAALLLALGFLTALLLLAVGFSYTTVMDRQGASASADLVRARLLAESGVDRALAFLQGGLATEVDPATKFFTPEADSAWSGRRYLASINGNDTEGIEEALAVTLNGLPFTPNATLHNSVGWIPIRSVRKIGSEQKDVLVGRLAYLVIDESGKIDPGAVVSSGEESEDETPDTGAEHTRTGASVKDISLADAGISNADAFRPESVTSGAAGQLAGTGTWQSIAQMAKSTGADANAMAEITQALHPFSRDEEAFWRDANANGICDEGETESRLNLSASFTLQQLYELFLGPDKDSAVDDATWLKEVSEGDWVKSWQEDSGLSIVQVRQRIAAQVAANMVDYVDSDSTSTLAYVDSDGQIQTGTLSGKFNLQGVEKQWGISAISMKIEVTTGGTHEVSGTLNINPSNSTSKEFQLQTPSGLFTRDNLQDQSCSYSYTGEATMIQINPKSTGRTLTIDGQSVTLSTSTCYTITADSMSVKLYNSHNDTSKTWGKAMGQWYLQIVEASNVTISPDPASSGFQFRPSFKGQAYYPFTTAADNEVSFDISSGCIVPSEDVTAEVTILGADISYGSSYSIPVTLSITAGTDTFTPWGDIDEPIDGNVNDGENPRTFTLEDCEGGASISVRATSWLKKKSYYSGTSKNHWSEYLSIDSLSGDDNVLVLRDGDSVPDIDPFMDQTDIGEIVKDYVEDGKVKLESNQAIFLFELGTTSLSSSAADFQDLVALVTLSKPGTDSSQTDTSAVLADNAPGDPQLLLECIIQVKTDSGNQETINQNLTLSFDQTAVVDGGYLKYTSEYTSGEWGTVTASSGDGYEILKAEIVSAKLVDSNDILDSCPLDDQLPLCSWHQSGTSSDDQTFFAHLQARDPLQNDRAEIEADFGVFWEAWPSEKNLAEGTETEPERIGQLNLGYESTPYSQITVKNAALARVGEIGRIHSYTPMQSLRLWSASTADESGHDAALLDLFKIGSAAEKSGKISCNSVQSGVLRALFKDATSVDADTAVAAVLAKRQAGTTFSNIGQLFGSVSGISGTDGTADTVEEEAIAKLAELVTVRQNCFTIIIVAQALKDVAGIKYDSDGDGVRDTMAQLNVLDVKHDADGNVVKYIDSIRGEQKLMAVVYRDALTNKFSIERFEYLQ
jgi:hypothetical protein